VTKDRRYPPGRTAAVRALLDAAQADDRVSLMVLYKDGVKPMEAEAAYEAIAGLKASREFPPLVTVTGSKASVEAALWHELTVGAVASMGDYNRNAITFGRRLAPQANGRSR
jgi:hypothetical protein